MKTQIDIICPDCHSSSFSIHGIKSYGKQNYQCKDCKRQFIGDHALTYHGCHS
ncbi:IS1/IS1595 family N-terminal zinc-binding domain-containing protein, partial [Psychrobacter faecalis]